jgi:hypothetical protein
LGEERGFQSVNGLELMSLKSRCEVDPPMLIVCSSCARDLLAETPIQAVLVVPGHIVNATGSADRSARFTDHRDIVAEVR